MALHGALTVTDFCFIGQQDSVSILEHNPDMPTFGDRVRKRRRELRLTQAQLAKKAGYKRQSAISAIENNKHQGTPRLIQLANALETTPEYLQNGGDDKSTRNVEMPTATYSSRLTYEEQRLLSAFRMLSSGQRETKVAEIEAMAKQNQELLRELSQDKSDGTHG